MERDRIEVARKEEAAAWAGKLASFQTASEEQISALRCTHAAEIAAMHQKEQTIRQNDLERIEAVRKESAKEMASYRKRLDKELAADKEKVKLEREASIQSMEEELTRREAATQQHFERTREEEMEMIIAKLDAEYAASRAECEALADKRVKAAEKSARASIEKLQTEQQEASRQAQVREQRLHSELQDGSSMQSRLESEAFSLNERLGEMEGVLDKKAAELESYKESTASSAQDAAAINGELVGGLQQRLQAEVLSKHIYAFLIIAHNTHVLCLYLELILILCRLLFFR